MSEKNIKTVQTSRGTLQYYRDWEEREGAIIMLNPQTVDRYYEMTYVEQPKTEDYGVFFAFGQEQFDEGLAKAKADGRIKEGEKIAHWGAGLYGTQEEIYRFFKWYDSRDERIKAECDPQEVYFYEYNNHESMYDYDGDEKAIKRIIQIWGLEVARKIKRYNYCYTLPEPQTI